MDWSIVGVLATLVSLYYYLAAETLRCTCRGVGLAPIGRLAAAGDHASSAAFLADGRQCCSFAVQPLVDFARSAATLSRQTAGGRLDAEPEQRLEGERGQTRGECNAAMRSPWMSRSMMP